MPSTAPHVSQLVIAPRRQILGDTRRNLRAISVILGIAFGFVLFSAGVASAVEKWSYGESLYFTAINVTTVGFGDLVPKTAPGRILASLNALIGLLLFGILVAVIALAFQPGEYTATATVEAPQSKDDHNREITESAGLANAIKTLLAAVESEVRQIKENPEGRRPPRTSVDIHVHGRGIVLHVDVDAG